MLSVVWPAVALWRNVRSINKCALLVLRNSTHNSVELLLAVRMQLLLCVFAFANVLFEFIFLLAIGQHFVACRISLLFDIISLYFIFSFIFDILLIVPSLPAFAGFKNNYDQAALEQHHRHQLFLKIIWKFQQIKYYSLHSILYVRNCFQNIFQFAYAKIYVQQVFFFCLLVCWHDTIIMYIYKVLHMYHKWAKRLAKFCHVAPKIGLIICIWTWIYVSVFASSYLLLLQSKKQHKQFHFCFRFRKCFQHMLPLSKYFVFYLIFS